MIYALDPPRMTVAVKWEGRAYFLDLGYSHLSMARIDRVVALPKAEPGVFQGVASAQPTVPNLPDRNYEVLGDVLIPPDARHVTSANIDNRTGYGSLVVVTDPIQTTTCRRCGAVVADVARHTEWHTEWHNR